MYTAGPGTASSSDLPPAAAAAAGAVQQPSKATIKVSALPSLRQSRLHLAQVAQPAYCTGLPSGTGCTSCFLHRFSLWDSVAQAAFAQVIASCTGCSGLHRLRGGRRCMIMSCML